MLTTSVAMPATAVAPVPAFPMATPADKLPGPRVEIHKGSFYVATPKTITRHDDIENKLDRPGDPVMVYDRLRETFRTAGSSSRSAPMARSTCPSARGARPMMASDDHDGAIHRVTDSS